MGQGSGRRICPPDGSVEEKLKCHCEKGFGCQMCLLYTQKVRCYVIDIWSDERSQGAFFAELYPLESKLQAASAIHRKKS